MKQRDVALIIVAVFVSAILAYFISGKVISTPSNRQQQVQVVPSVSPSFSAPDSKYFNSSSIDPSKTIQIENSSNQTPFNSQSSPTE